MKSRFPLLVLLLLVSSQPASAYSILTSNGHDSFRWPSGDEVPWSYDPAGSDDLPIGVIRDGLGAAFAAWGGVPCATIEFSQEGPSLEATDGRIHVVFEEESWDPATQDAAAVAETFRNSKGEIVRSTLRFNGVDMRWSVGDDPLDPFVVDFQGVATHEIGHAIGLGHSRERHAAMFFAGGDSGGRELDADDRRGLCFVYPSTSFASGGPCDSCTAHEHCASGACLFFSEQGGFCGQDCVSNGSDQAPCPSGFVCEPVDGLADQCLPRFGHCDEEGGSIPLGESCYGDATCASGICLATPESAFCTASCDPNQPNSCADGSVCVPSGSEGLCVHPGPLTLGQPCGSHNDCAGTLCVETLAGGVCSQHCASEEDCPDEALCMAEVCVPPGPRPLGTSCESHFDCQTQTCVVDEGNRSFCTQRCNHSGSPCPEGSVCVAYGELDFCRSAGTQPEGGPCRVTEGCENGLLCQPGDDEATWAFCARSCAPHADAGECSEGEICEWAPVNLSDGVPTGRCAKPAGAYEGALCGPEEGPCQHHLLCVQVDGEEWRCRPDCLLGDDAACPTGMRCWDLDDPARPGRGACSLGNRDVWMPGDPRPETPESGPAPQKIEVVPIEDAPPPPSSGGCASGADDTTPLWLFVLLLLLVERQRHRRPHWVRRRLAGVGDYKEEGASEETSAWVEKTWVA